MNRWAVTSGVSEAAVRQIIDGTRITNIISDTYEKLAQGASVLLNRQVSTSELMQVCPSKDFQSSMDENREKRRLALQKFFEDNLDGLVSMNKWAIASGIAYNTINENLLGKKSKKHSL